MSLPPLAPPTLPPSLLPALAPPALPALPSLSPPSTAAVQVDTRPGLLDSSVLERAQAVVSSRDEPLAPMNCLVCDEPMTQVTAMQVHPNCVIDPEYFAADLIAKVRAHVVGQPRNHQTMIGPSEIGSPCDRRIGYKIAGVKALNDRGIAWKAFVGTCIHSEMQVMMAGHEVARWAPNGELISGRVQARYHIEERVEVGDYGAGPFGGSTDLFDAATGIVWDWKFPGRNQIERNYKPKGPGRQYHTQAHTYGKGWRNRGFEVTNVGIIMFSRDGEFIDRYVFTEAYDEKVADDAIARVGGLYSAIKVLGASVAIPSFPTADAYCQHCPWFTEGHTDLTTGCPGDASREATVSDPFRGLA